MAAAVAPSLCFLGCDQGAAPADATNTDDKKEGGLKGSSEEESTEEETEEGNGGNGNGGNTNGGNTNGGNTNGGNTNGGPNGGADAGAGAGGGSGMGAFFGDKAYTATEGPSTSQEGHAFINSTPFVLLTPSGNACLSCHDGAALAPKFIAGGTVYTDAKATAVAPKVEVRLHKSDGKFVSVYTDSNGNFFLKADDADKSTLKHAGIRDDKKQMMMDKELPDGNCNKCHSGATGGTPVIHL
jgi:hypothetical protein